MKTIGAPPENPAYVVPLPSVVRPLSGQHPPSGTAWAGDRVLSARDPIATTGQRSPTTGDRRPGMALPGDAFPGSFP